MARRRCGIWVELQRVNSSSPGKYRATTPRVSTGIGASRWWMNFCLTMTSASARALSMSPVPHSKVKAWLLSHWEWTSGEPGCSAFSRSETAGSGS